jgi:hypothetical protein
MQNKFQFIFLCMLVLLLDSVVHADQLPNKCSATIDTKSVDLRSEMPPIRDQDSIGWCYGYTAADLISHYLYKTKGKVLSKNTPNADYRLRSFSVSAMGISTAYNEIQKPKYANSIRGKTLSQLSAKKIKVIAEGGSITEAIMAGKQRGICFEKDVSSEDYGYVEDFRCAIKNQCKISDVLNLIYELPGKNLNCQNLTNIHKMFSSLNLASIKKVLSTSARENAVANLVNANCNTRFKDSFFELNGAPETESLTLSKTQTSAGMMQLLDRQLDNGTPVGIMYYSDFLYNDVSSKKLQHASSIVGKRFNPTTCEVEYILRNSIGTGCGYYVKNNPGITVCVDELKTLIKKRKNNESGKVYFDGMIACKKNNKPIPSNPRVRCEDSSSYLFVRRSDLEKNIFNVTAIKENTTILSRFGL